MRPERMPGSRRRTWAVGAALLLVLLAAACGSPRSGRHGKQGPAYRPKGTLLLKTGYFRNRLISFKLPSGPGREFQAPFQGGLFEDSFPGPNGTAFMAVPENAGPLAPVQLFQVSLDHSARAIGDLLTGAQAFDVVGGRAIGWGCYRQHRSIFMLDLSAGSRWTTVAEGCAAALSPDAGDMAFFRGGSLYRMSLPGGRPERILDLHSVAGLAEAGVTRFPDDLASVEWGQGGISLLVGRRTSWAIVVYRTGREPMVVPLGQAGPGLMSWQPRGRLLAFSDYIGQTQTNEVRVVDAATGVISEVAVTQNFGQFQWSPDGRVLAVTRNTDLTSFVDLRGNVLARIPTGGVPDAWAP